MAKYPLMRSNILREDLDAVIAHLQGDDPILTNGPNCAAFEREWSEWLGVKHSVFVNAGASANLLSMAVLKIRHPEGGEVIVPPLTWVSDIATVLQNGFTPVFVDIDPRSLGDGSEAGRRQDHRQDARRLPHPRAGLRRPRRRDARRARAARHPADRGRVRVARRDARRTKRLGSFGWMSNFSFYYAHHMSTIEGGMVCTNDDTVYQQLRMLRGHGMVRESTDANERMFWRGECPDLNPDFIFAYPAYNVRNTEIGGIMGRSQLKRLDANVESARRTCTASSAASTPRRYQTDFKLEGSSNYAFNLIMKDADDEYVERLMATMRETGIEFRRGSAGGGNQVRQPYLRGIVPQDHHLRVPEDRARPLLRLLHRQLPRHPRRRDRCHLRHRQRRLSGRR